MKGEQDQSQRFLAVIYMAFGIYSLRLVSLFMQVVDQPEKNGKTALGKVISYIDKFWYLVVLATLITATIFRFEHAGKVCSGDFLVSPCDTDNCD